MENCRAIICAVLFLELVLPTSVLAYEPTTAHRALTREVGEFYNESNGKYLTPKLSDEDIANMEKGAMAEDDGLRMAHHFYDPIHDIGLKGYVSSKVWAQSPYYQANWRPGVIMHLENALLDDSFESPADYSWQRGIYEYVYGDKARAMESLGHTLHLIEDASVPDHTRNDAHIPIADKAIAAIDPRFKQESPFEKFTDRFSVENGNVHTAYELTKDDVAPYFGLSLDEYFDHAAQLSNQNFFSKSTILSSEFKLPVIEKEISLGEQTYGEYQNHPIVLVRTTKDHITFEDIKEYSIPYDDEYLLGNYWKYSSRNAVTHGAGVVRLFFIEVENERKTGALKASQKSAVKQAEIKVYNFIAYTGQKGANVVTGSIAWIGNIGRSLAGDIALGMTQSSTQIASLFSHPDPIAALPTPVPPPAPQPTPTTQTHIAPTPSTTREQQLALLVSELIEAKRQLALIQTNTANVPSSPEILGASTTIAVIATSTPPLPQVRIDEGIPQGSAPTQTQETVSPTPTPTPPPTAPLPPPDTTAPDRPLVIAPADPSAVTTTSITISGTAEASSTVTLLVFGTTTNALLYDVGADGLWNFALTLGAGATSISLTATDEAGNISSSTDLTLVVTLPPATPTSSDWPYPPHSLLFSEVAWSGTQTSPNDEWIELVNRSEHDIDLSGYYVVNDDRSLVIELSTIIPKGNLTVFGAHYPTFMNYLPAATPDFGSGIPDEGTHLMLVYGSASSTIVVDEIPYCPNWCGKGGAGGQTIMRTWDAAGSADWNEWITGDQVLTGVRDANWQPVYGTPWELSPSPMIM